MHLALRASLLFALLQIPINAQTPSESVPLVTGKRITPQGRQTNVGSYPANMTLTPDGKYVVVTNAGFRQFVHVLSASDGSVVSRMEVSAQRTDGSNKKEGLYYGIAIGAEDGAGGRRFWPLYLSRGAEDRVWALRIDSEGNLRNPEGDKATFTFLDARGEGWKPENAKHLAGIALSGDGRTLFAANNETGPQTNLQGSLSIIDVPGRKLKTDVTVGGYPFAVAAITRGPNADKKVYAASERDGLVQVVDPREPGLVGNVRVGEQPQGVLLNKDHSRLYVANSGSDTVSVLDTAIDRVVKTFLIRPDDVRGLPGSTPNNLALSPDERRLYVTLGDMNSVAVIDLKTGRLIGYIPVGWNPTAVVVSTDNKRLFVANAKGVNARYPNAKEVLDRGRYIQNIIEGTVSTIPVPTDSELKRLTRVTLVNNLRPLVDDNPKSKIQNPKSDSVIRHPSIFKNPGIRHVIYIIKENRTYDQVLGDLPKGNGDPSICLFPREVTPNQHALAERFALLDNFYCCAEVSADGWQWSVSGMISAYTARNAPYNYSGRGKIYDQEGQNHGVPVDLHGVKDVARPPSGYIWDQCAKKGISYRNYGFYVSFTDPGEISMEGRPKAVDNTPNKKALVGHTDLNFRLYDMRYADSDAWVMHNAPAPNQLKEYGAHKAPSRFAAWKREFDQFVKNGKLPRFTMIRLPRDHTSGTSAGAHSPRAMVADNDYAVGQVVEAVSKSPYWKSSAIFILEDDAQNGFDHVDAHRSIAFVISPFVKRSVLDSRFYNTDSMLRTMGLLLGLPPLCQYDAVASPIDVFGPKPENSEPYSAILPKREIIAEVNRRTAYRAADSARLLNPYREESAPDEELNDILWGALKPGIRKPPIRYSLRMDSAERIPPLRTKKTRR